MSEAQYLNPKTVGLIIALPFCGRPVTPEWAVSMMNQNYPLNLRRMLCTSKGEAIDIARTKTAQEAIKYKAKYVWFVDDDVAPPFHAVRSLFQTLEQAPNDVMVAGGIYCAKTNPTEPVVYRGNGYGAFWNWKVGDIFECTGIGTGCMLIKTELFKRLPEPWFKTVDEDGTPETPIVQESDDMYFCDKVIGAGYKILADTRVQCIHWDVETYTPYMLPPDCYPALPKPEGYQSPAPLSPTDLLEMGYEEKELYAVHHR